MASVVSRTASKKVIVRIEEDGLPFVVCQRSLGLFVYRLYAYETVNLRHLGGGWSSFVE